MNNLNVVLDPTLLLNKYDYEEIINSQTNNEKKNIFCYILDNNNKVKILTDSISKILELPCNGIVGINDFKEPYPAVEEWLFAIQKSEFVITDSFHGTVFAIIFNVPFIVCINNNRGAERFISLLNKLDLFDRIYNKDTGAGCRVERLVRWLEHVVVGGEIHS